MKIKSLIIIDEETGKEYAFAHHSIVEVKPYDPASDPEVQGTGLTQITSNGEGSTAPIEPSKASKTEVKVEKKLKAKKKK